MLQKYRLFECITSHTQRFFDGEIVTEGDGMGGENCFRGRALVFLNLSYFYMNLFVLSQKVMEWEKGRRGR